MGIDGGLDTRQAALRERMERAEQWQRWMLDTDRQTKPSTQDLARSRPEDNRSSNREPSPFASVRCRCFFSAVSSRR